MPRKPCDSLPLTEAQKLANVRMMVFGALPQPVPKLPSDGSDWPVLAEYFQQVLRSIPAHSGPEFSTHREKPWREQNEWESWVGESTGVAVEALHQLVTKGAWPLPTRRDDFWPLVRQRIEIARDLCTLMGTPLVLRAGGSIHVVPPPDVQAIAIIWWLLTDGWVGAPGGKERYAPNFHPKHA